MTTPETRSEAWRSQADQARDTAGARVVAQVEGSGLPFEVHRRQQGRPVAVEAHRDGARVEPVAGLQAVLERRLDLRRAEAAGGALHGDLQPASGLQAGDAERRRRFDDPAGLDRSGRAERGRAEQRAGGEGRGRALDQVGKGQDVAAGGHVPAQAQAVGPGHGGDREHAEHRDG
jgi:hypothetical protein